MDVKLHIFLARFTFKFLKNDWSFGSWNKNKGGSISRAYSNLDLCEEKKTHYRMHCASLLTAIRRTQLFLSNGQSTLHLRYLTFLVVTFNAAWNAAVATAALPAAAVPAAAHCRIVSGFVPLLSLGPRSSSWGPPWNTKIINAKEPSSIWSVAAQMVLFKRRQL